MEEFLTREAITGNLYKQTTGKPYYPPQNKTEFVATIREERLSMWEYLRNVSACPGWKAMKDFLIIPPRPGMNTSLLKNEEERKIYEKKIDVFAAGRTAYYYDDYWHSQKVIHFISRPGCY
jgi:hypothetical protein